MHEQTPSRHEYQISIESMQSKVDMTLEELQSDIEMANLTLEELCREGDESKTLAYANETIAYLNKNWAYVGHEFTVSGNWHESVQTINLAQTNGILRLSLQKNEVACESVSHGFSIVQTAEYDDKPVYHFALLFANGLKTAQTAFGKISITPFAYAEPHEVSLAYVRECSDKVVSGEVEEIVTSIVVANQSLTEFLQDESHGFFRLSHDEQQHFFRSMIDSLETKMPIRGTEDYLLLEEAEANMAYIADHQGSKTTLDSISSDQGVPIEGFVLGFCIPDEIENKGKVHYKSVADFKYADQGIGLIVQPAPGTNTYLPSEYQEHDFVVPMNELQMYAFRMV